MSAGMYWFWAMQEEPGGRLQGTHRVGGRAAAASPAAGRAHQVSAQGEWAVTSGVGHKSEARDSHLRSSRGPTALLAAGRAPADCWPVGTCKHHIIPGLHCMACRCATGWQVTPAH
jgi:hypothetical protein